MNYDELTDREKEVWDEAHELAWDAGFEEGYQACLDESESQDDSYDDGYHAGVLAERQRVQDVLQMMFDAALNMGQGNKAVQYKNTMDLLRPVDIEIVYDND